VYYVVRKNLEHAVGLSYDGVYVYWTGIMSGEEAIIRSKEDGSDLEVIVDAGTYA
jgi:membrane-bound inhibitor of C-type lysozyme